MNKKLTNNNMVIRSGLVRCNKNLIYSAIDRHGIVRSINEALPSETEWKCISCDQPLSLCKLNDIGYYWRHNPNSSPCELKTDKPSLTSYDYYTKYLKSIKQNDDNHKVQLHIIRYPVIKFEINNEIHVVRDLIHKPTEVDIDIKNYDKEINYNEIVKQNIQEIHKYEQNGNNSDTLTLNYPIDNDNIEILNIYELQLLNVLYHKQSFHRSIFDLIDYTEIEKSWISDYFQQTKKELNDCSSYNTVTLNYFELYILYSKFYENIEMNREYFINAHKIKIYFDKNKIISKTYVENKKRYVYENILHPCRVIIDNKDYPVLPFLIRISSGWYVKKNKTLLATIDYSNDMSFRFMQYNRVYYKRNGLFPNVHYDDADIQTAQNIEYELSENQSHFVDLNYLINIIKSNEQNISDHSLVCECLYYFPQLTIKNSGYDDINMLLSIERPSDDDIYCEYVNSYF